MPLTRTDSSLYIEMGSLLQCVDGQAGSLNANPIPGVRLLVPEARPDESAAWPGTGLGNPQLLLWVSRVVSVQQGPRGGVFLTRKDSQHASQHAGDLTLPGPETPRRLRTGPWLPQADTGVLRVPPEPPCSAVGQLTPGPAHGLSSVCGPRTDSVLTHSFFPFFDAVRRPRCVCPVPPLGLER